MHETCYCTQGTLQSRMRTREGYKPVDITPEMAEAAAEAYAAWRADGGEADGAVEALARSVFQAMVDARDHARK